MMKRVLMVTLCLSCVTLGGHAIDINIPGADPTVLKDAYQNYRKTDAEALQMEQDVEKDIKTYMPKQVVGNGELINSSPFIDLDEKILIVCYNTINIGNK